MTTQTQTWNYSDGDPDFNAVIVLAAPLPQNGTVDVTPLTVNFAPVQGVTQDGTMFYTPGFEPTVAPVYQFTTVGGQITAFDVSLTMGTPGTNTPTYLTYTLSSQGDSYTEQSYGYDCPAVGCPTYSATSVPGTWTDPPASVPELSQDLAAVLVLVGLLAVLRGGKRLKAL
jgi:hypothetical protein